MVDCIRVYLITTFLWSVVDGEIISLLRSAPFTFDNFDFSILACRSTRRLNIDEFYPSLLCNYCSAKGRQRIKYSVRRVCVVNDINKRIFQFSFFQTEMKPSVSDHPHLLAVLKSKRVPTGTQHKCICQYICSLIPNIYVGYSQKG